tara:strand:- start:1585 stop:1791 length:207 start_codon:yes stop_codon:yes gene_type:complete
MSKPKTNKKQQEATNKKQQEATRSNKQEATNINRRFAHLKTLTDFEVFLEGSILCILVSFIHFESMKL